MVRPTLEEHELRMHMPRPSSLTASCQRTVHGVARSRVEFVIYLLAASRSASICDAICGVSHFTKPTILYSIFGRSSSHSSTSRAEPPPSRNRDVLFSTSASHKFWNVYPCKVNADLPGWNVTRDSIQFLEDSFPCDLRAHCRLLFRSALVS